MNGGRLPVLVDASPHLQPWRMRTGPHTLRGPKLRRSSGHLFFSLAWHRQFKVPTVRYAVSCGAMEDGAVVYITAEKTSRCIYADIVR